MESDFEGEKTICSLCGAPVFRRRMASGTVYLVSILEEVLASYFDTHEEVDNFLKDRIQRAERIIVDLRKALADKT